MLQIIYDDITVILKGYFAIRFEPLRNDHESNEGKK